MMKYPKSDRYDAALVAENLMGPSSLKMIEELTDGLDLRPGMKVLDLGCGKGLTSIFLAREFGVTVYATDLWIGATENFERFERLGLSDLIIPIHADALALPFADHYFDALVSVDAYYYFGMDDALMDEKIAPLVKPEGLLAIAFPGFKKDIHGALPPEFLLSWKPEDLDCFQTCGWWENLLKKSQKIEIDSITEMNCFDDAWRDWLESDISYAINDRKAMNAGAGNYMNLIAILAHRKPENGTQPEKIKCRQ